MKGALLVAGVVVSAAASMAACRSPTELRVVVTTNVPCGSFKGAAVSVGTLGPELEKAPASTTTTTCLASGYVGTLVVVPSGSSDSNVAIRVVEGVDTDLESCTADNQYKGCIVARRALNFIPHETLSLDVPMEATCENVPCPVDQTCVQGSCRSAQVVDPGSCATASCGEGSLQPPDGGTTDGTIPDGGAMDGAGDGGSGDAQPDGSVTSGDASNGGCSGGGCGLALGGKFTCAVRDGGVTCWGQNTNGQLGRATDMSTTPGAVLGPGASPLGGVRGIIATTDDTCAFVGGGAVSCWGYGDAFGPVSANPPGYPVATTVAAMQGASIVAPAENEACWVSAGGMLFCTDNNQPNGRLAHSNLDGGPGPTPVALGGPFAQVAAGFQFMCAILANDKSVWCLGDNGANQSNPGGPVTTTAPAKVTLAAGSLEIALQTSTACARATTGRVYCWGNSSFGQAGLNPDAGGGMSVSEVLLADGGPLDALQIASGDDFACARMTDATIVCWGIDDNGQLGRGGATMNAGFSFRATTVVGADGGAPFTGTFLGANGAHACAIANDGSLWCWGRNGDGELGVGVGDSMNRSRPTRSAF